MRVEHWIKQFLPRGLYGRAALILIVPVITIQLVVSLVFLQRHFEDVAQHLSSALSLDLNLILDTWDTQGEPVALDIANALDIAIEAPDFDGGVERAFYDISGITVIEVLEASVPEIIGIDLQSNPSALQILVDRGQGGPVAFNVARRRASSPAPHQLLVIMVLTGILMTLVAYLFLRNQLRPIRRLALAAEAFGKGRSIAYHPSGATEVRSAGRAFLDMRARIEGQIEQRTLMLSGVSHDLRTPLTRMRLAIGMMEEGTDRDDLAHDVEEMEALLNTFLDFVRGDALDDPELCDPVVVAKRVVENARRSGQAVELVGSEETIDVLLRPMAIQRALVNLVSNAQRYGERVRLTVVISRRSVRFSVEDDGSGIPQERRSDALRPFIRLDEARNQNKGSGVGLGLAIADDIARRHGGTLSLGESVDLGGLRADLMLPR